MKSSIFIIFIFIAACSSERGERRQFHNQDYQENKRKGPAKIVKRRAYKRPSNRTKETDTSGSLWTGEGKIGNLFINDETRNNGDIVQIDVSSSLKNQILLELRRYLPGIKSINVHRMVGVIVQKINKKHLLLRARKTIHYKNNSKLVEVQALVLKRDINYNNSIDSDNILEVTIRVFR